MKQERIYRAKIKLKDSWESVYPKAKNSTLFRSVEEARNALERKAGEKECRGLIYSAKNQSFSPNLPEFNWADESVITIQF